MARRRGRRRGRTASRSASSCCAATTRRRPRRGELLQRSFRESWVAKRADLDKDGPPAEGSPRARMQATMQHFADHVEAIPVIVLVGLERYRPANPYEGASVYPACQNLLLAARALGYGGALTGWHHAVEPELRTAARHPRRRRPVGVHHARRAGRAPRSAAPQAVAHARPRRPMGPGRHVARGPGRWLTTPTRSSASSPARARRSCGLPGAAGPRSCTPTTPAARPRPCAGSTWPSSAALADVPRRRPARRSRRPTSRPPRARHRCPRPGGRIAHDVASFTIEALPAEAFEAAADRRHVARRGARRRTAVPARRRPRGAVRVLVPPRPRARRRVDAPSPLTLASLDDRPVPDLDTVRDAWVADLNTLGRPDPDAL